MIKRCCENCVHGRLNDYDTCYWCKHNAEVNPKDRETNPKFEEYFAPKEQLVRADERNKILETISKVCTNENTKFSFQLDGKNYQVTQVGSIDTFEEAIREDEREKMKKCEKCINEDNNYEDEYCWVREDVYREIINHITELTEKYNSEDVVVYILKYLKTYLGDEQ